LTVALSVETTLAKTGEMEDRLAHGLGRDGPGVHAHAANLPPLLDDGRPEAKLGRLDRRSRPGGPGADRDQVEVHRTTRSGYALPEQGGHVVDFAAFVLPTRAGALAPAVVF
jgi:hypothetical protein